VANVLRTPNKLIKDVPDPILPLDAGWRFARAIGAQIDHVILGVGHFVQEDAGPQVGRLISTWLKAQLPGKR
jgi:pimeloyl-ACP methyl ester carboxylesterase